MRLIVLLLLLALPCAAKYMAADLTDIPVSRLLATAGAKVKKNPKDGQAHFELGRIYLLAYATQATVMQAERATETLPHEPGGFWPPAQVSEPSSAASKKNLQRAVTAFRQAVTLNPNLLPAQLSYAWTLEKSGEKAKAVAQYRSLIDKAWPLEKSHERAIFGKSLSREGAGYLIALLDPQQDAAEIARLEQIRSEAAKIPRAMTPILLPLEEAPFEALVDAASPVRFDLDGSGRRQQWGWLTPKAAWLVYLDRRERVESALQLFGSVSFLAFWEHGYAALAALDEDGDGVLQGAELHGLKLWQDADCDGECRPTELITLEAAGITALETRWERRPGYLESPQGVRYRDGRTGPSYDWIRP